MLRDWWGKHVKEDARPFHKTPFAMVMLRFYRWVWGRIQELRALPSPTAEDRADILSLERMLQPPTAESFLEKLEKSWSGKLTTSGDPIWDEWVRAVETGKIPEKWWGPLKPR